MKHTIIGEGGPKLQQRIAMHRQAWTALKHVSPPRYEIRPFITISRQFGCEARALASELAQLLNERCRPKIPWTDYDQQLLDLVAEELHLSREFVESLDGHRRDEMSELFHAILNTKVDEALIFRKMAEVVRTLATHGNAVLVGRGSYLLTQDLRNGLHVRLEASASWRAHKVAEERKVSMAEGRKIVEQGEKERQQFIRSFFVSSPEEHDQHDIVVNNARFNLSQIAEIVFSALSARFGEVLVGD